MTQLVNRSVRAFLASVASPREPVPAGGSVAALVGAGAAALLALVCGARSVSLLDARQRAERLQQRLVELIDEDAAAYRAFLDARGDDAARAAAAEHAARVPLAIAHACDEVLGVCKLVESAARGPLRGDVRTAQLLAHAARDAAASLAEQDARILDDVAARERLLGDLAVLVNNE